MTSPAELLGNFKVGLALGRAGASGCKDRDQALELSSSFKHEKLLLDLNFRDAESVATQRNNQMVGRQSL
jgi:hypothetical protein